MVNKRGRTALITGSGRKRVGYVIGRRLARAGIDVAVHFHKSEDSAQQNVAEFRECGVRSETFQADVSDESAVRQLVDNVCHTFGSIDVMVTTSSIWKSIPLEQLTASDVLSSFKVNTLGTFLCCRYAGLRMVEQESGGNIVTICDSLIEHPYLDHAAYFTAKGAIPTMTRCFAVELAARNPKVRVNCISPGPVMLPDEMAEEERKARVDSTLVKEADDPESVAATVQFLIDNPMVSGACIPVDGGRNVAFEHHRRSKPDQ